MKNDDLKDENDAMNSEKNEEMDTAEKTEESDADNKEIDLDEEFVETDEEGSPMNSSGPAVLNSLRDKLKKALEEKQQYLNSWQKDKAEFINIRKRDEDAKNEFVKFAEQRIVENMLPTLDSFELALNHGVNISDATEAKNFESYKKGIDGIYQNFISFLSKYNVVPFGNTGEVFDHNLHHSIALTETDDSSKDGIISEVLQKGYIMKDKVIRPAMVKVYEVAHK